MTGSGVRSRLAAWRERGTRGSVEVATAVVIAALLGGTLFGNGVARTVVDTFDGLTWLADDERGEVVQVNPNTGKPESRLRVGQPGSDLSVEQRDGLLVVTDNSAGTVNVIDLATLLTSGRRDVSPGGDTEVLLDGSRIYVVDRAQGTITNVDPSSARTIGEPWTSPADLADAAVDRHSTVWAIHGEGRLFELSWSDDANRFVEQGQRTVSGAGPDALLVAHDRGVTVLGPEGGVVVQVATGNDRAIAVPSLRGPVKAAEASPADLVPAAVEDSGTVIIVRDEEVLEVGVADVGCDRPGRPAVFQDLVYVPCLGARKVIVLDRDGRTARPDIVTPEGGEPELVLDDGRLVLNVPGADTGVVVEADGTTRTVTTREPDDRPRDPTRRPPPPRPNTPPPPPAAPPPAAGPVTPIPPGPPDPPVVATPPPTSATATPPAPPPTTPRPPDPPGYSAIQPREIAAVARPDGTVLVTWKRGPKRPNNYRIYFAPADAPAPRPGLPGETSAMVLAATVPGTASSGIVTTVPPGQEGTFLVEGTLAADGPPPDVAHPFLADQFSESVVVYTHPGAPGDVRVDRVLTSEDGGSLLLIVVWDDAAANGRKITEHRVTVSSAGAVLRETGEGVVIVPCPGDDCDGIELDVEVVAVNEAGPGPPGVVHWPTPDPDPDPAPDPRGQTDSLGVVPLVGLPLALWLAAAANRRRRCRDHGDHSDRRRSLSGGLR